MATQLNKRGRETEKQSMTLRIEMISEIFDETGNFTCIAENRFGLDQSTGRLVVLRGPVMVEEPLRRLYTSVGQSETLRCVGSAEGILDLAYIWKHNGITLRFDLNSLLLHDSLEVAHYNRSHVSIRFYFTGCSLFFVYIQ